MMSMITRLEIQYLDDKEIDFDATLARIGELLDEDGIHHDVLKGLKTAFETGESVVHVDASYLRYLITRLAGIAPQASFAARGLGEALRQTWVLESDTGEIVFDEGPWDD